MTNHLVRGHLSPLARGLGIELRDAFAQGAPGAWISQSSHASESVCFGEDSAGRNLSVDMPQLLASLVQRAPLRFHQVSGRRGQVRLDRCFVSGECGILARFSSRDDGLASPCVTADRKAIQPRCSDAAMLPE